MIMKKLLTTTLLVFIAVVTTQVAFALNFVSNDITGDLGNSWRAISFDADGDSDLDLYAANFNQQNRLWINDGSGNFTAADITGDLGNSFDSTVFDADGDSDLDLYAVNTINRQNRLWLNRPLPTITITPTTILDNTSITDTTIRVEDTTNTV